MVILDVLVDLAHNKVAKILTVERLTAGSSDAAEVKFENVSIPGICCRRLHIAFCISRLCFLISNMN